MFSYLGFHACFSRFGNVILHVPGSMPSTLAKPLLSSVPSAAVSPSGRMTRYDSPGTGLSFLSTNSISIQLVFFSFSSGVWGGLWGLICSEPYLPVLVLRCSALIFSTSPGSATSASSAALGSAGVSSDSLFPVFLFIGQGSVDPNRRALDGIHAISFEIQGGTCLKLHAEFRFNTDFAS